MTTVIPACDGSGRYLIEVDPDEVDGPDVLYIVEPYEYFTPRSLLTRRELGRSRRGGRP
jgi:hypothetical protein